MVGGVDEVFCIFYLRSSVVDYGGGIGGYADTIGIVGIT